VKAAVGPYVRGNGNEYYFFSMTSRKSFAVNAALSNKPLAAISNPERTVVVYEAAPAPDGTRAAAFADGHVERFPQTQWPAIARASGIPTP
jgi:prepilin-type processing-associated H-X9-DG protein